MATMTVTDTFAARVPYAQGSVGVYPNGKPVFFNPQKKEITPSPQIDEFVKTLPKKENEVEKEKPTATTGRKLGVSLASVLYSGLGQAVNGQWGKALGFSIGESVATIAGFCLGGPLGAVLGAAIVKGLSIYDAVKNV